MRFLFVAIFLFITSPIQAANIIVVDGDTFKIGSQKIRLWGIDAPELLQSCKKDNKDIACGEISKTVLTGIINSGEVKCKTVDIDRYKRNVAKCFIGDRDVAGMLVQMGWALDYKTYSKKYYDDFQKDAHSENRGIWALKFDKPWDWRKGQRFYKK